MFNQIITKIYNNNKAFTKLFIAWIVIVVAVLAIFNSPNNLGFDIAESKRLIVTEQNIENLSNELYNTSQDVYIYRMTNSQGVSYTYIELDNHSESVEQVKQILTNQNITFSEERINPSLKFDLEDVLWFIVVLNLFTMISAALIWAKRDRVKNLLALAVANLHINLAVNVILIIGIVILSNLGWQINYLTLILLVCANILASLISLALENNMVAEEVFDSKSVSQSTMLYLNTNMAKYLTFATIVSLVFVPIAYMYDFRVEALIGFITAPLIIKLITFFIPLYQVVAESSLGKTKKSTSNKKKK